MAEDSSEVVREAAESVGFVNTKALGDAPAWFQNLVYSSAANQHQLNLSMAATLATKAQEQVIMTSPTEGAVEVAAANILSRVASNVPVTMTPGSGTAP